MLLWGCGVRTGNKISLRLKYLPEYLITRPSLSIPEFFNSAKQTETLLHSVPTHRYIIKTRIKVHIGNLTI